MSTRQQSIHSLLAQKSGAIISPCGAFRYMLWRRWGDGNSFAHFHLLNPSKADAARSDPTLCRGVGFAQRWGMDGVICTNLGAFRATAPNDWMAAANPFGPDNDLWVTEVAKVAAISVAAWGANGTFRDANKRALALTIDWHHLGLTKDGQPKHPLARGQHRIPDDQQPLPFTRATTFSAGEPKHAARETASSASTAPVSSGEECPGTNHTTSAPALGTCDRADSFSAPVGAGAGANSP